MRKVILNLAVTLDGFIEGPNGEIDWCIIDDEPGQESFFDRFLAEVDSIFYGRVSYDLWGEYQPGSNASGAEKKLWDTVHSKRKYVFSRQPGKQGGATYINSDIVEKVQAIKGQPGKDIWLYGGASLITSFINAGLIDAYLLAVHPVLLGGGKPLFTGIQQRINLRLIDSTVSGSGVILLHYGV